MHVFVHKYGDGTSSIEADHPAIAKFLLQKIVEVVANVLDLE